MWRFDEDRPGELIHITHIHIYIYASMRIGQVASSYPSAAPSQLSFSALPLLRSALIVAVSHPTRIGKPGWIGKGAPSVERQSVPLMRGNAISGLEPCTDDKGVDVSSELMFRVPCSDVYVIEMLRTYDTDGRAALILTEPLSLAQTEALLKRRRQHFGGTCGSGGDVVRSTRQAPSPLPGGRPPPPPPLHLNEHDNVHVQWMQTRWHDPASLIEPIYLAPNESLSCQRPRRKSHISPYVGPHTAAGSATHSYRLLTLRLEAPAGRRQSAGSGLLSTRNEHKVKLSGLRACGAQEGGAQVGRGLQDSGEAGRGLQGGGQAGRRPQGGDRGGGFFLEFEWHRMGGMGDVLSSLSTGLGLAHLLGLRLLTHDPSQPAGTRLERDMALVARLLGTNRSCDACEHDAPTVAPLSYPALPHFPLPLRCRSPLRALDEVIVAHSAYDAKHAAIDLNRLVRERPAYFIYNFDQVAAFVAKHKVARTESRSRCL